LAFWDRFFGGRDDGVTPNDNGASAYSPGDPDGMSFDGEPTFHNRSLSFPMASAWDGWPGDWSTPAWDNIGSYSGGYGLSRLIDTAWFCIDLNASVLSSMPVYRLQDGTVADSPSWMTNPDPTIYTSWQEFAKQLFWDYHMGEAFVLPMATGPNGMPMNFRVIPPWLINVEMRGGSRDYMLGSTNVTDDILHIRYQSTTVDARGHGPLEAAGARMTAAGLLQRYAMKLAETGGTPHYWIGIDSTMTKEQAADYLDQWVDSRTHRAGEPALMTRGGTLNQLQSMNAKDMSLLELAQFNESRVAVSLGVPPYLAGLPSGGDSLTYSNVEQLFEFHDRSSLRPKATAVMGALSGWALPTGESCELNRDEYSRPGLLERAQAQQIWIANGVTTPQAVASMERLTSEPSAVSLTGGDDT
jgi:HK97 family phage portal protein